MIAHDPLHPYILELSGADPGKAAIVWRAYRGALTLAADAQPPAALLTVS